MVEKFPYPPFLLQRLRRVTFGGAGTADGALAVEIAASSA